MSTAERELCLPSELESLARAGMALSFHARVKPHAIAVFSQRGTRTFAQLNTNANRLVHVLANAGIGHDDGVALLCPNIPEFLEVYCATRRSGLRLTPVNWHLTGPEVAHIVADSRAKVLIAHADFAAAAAQACNERLAVRLAIGGAIPGFDSYEDALHGQPDTDPTNPRLGGIMLYTAGTTGRPKGVYRRNPLHIGPQYAGTLANYDPDTDVNLLCGPAYHGGPLTFDVTYPLVSGVPIVMMEKFDAETMLQLIERHRVTHTHMVATMFQRLLKLPEATRARYDLSSLKVVMHGAAPTPPEVKRAMIEWWGPVFWEYYAATEGNARFRISSQEWLRKPGSVGKLQPECGAQVLDEDGKPTTPGVVGEIYFRNNPQSPFEYFNAPEHERGRWRGEHFSVGDLGYVDEDGYLFLVGRTADRIIVGGVNIHPQEIDEVLLKHPAVSESCTVGVPNDEWGEEVRGVVVLNEGYSPSPELAAELIAFVRSNIASYKAPRRIDFVAELPRSETGKLQRRVVRQRYWASRTREI